MNGTRELAGRIRVLRRIRSEIPIPPIHVLEPGVYPCVVNPLGAVSVPLPDGGFIGVKPGEFEWVERTEAPR